MSRDRSATVADVIGVAFATSIGRLFDHEAGIRRQGDSEDVHQARVAIRRLRSDLRTFGDFVDEDWATELRAELRWLGAELGEVRDIEVLLDRLRADLARLGDSEHHAGRQLIDRLVADWYAARAGMLESLSTVRYETLHDRLLVAARHPRCTTWANLHAAQAVPPLVRRRWERLRDAVDELGEQPSDEALHGVRIRAKRARYAAEASTPVFGDDARRFARAMARVQEVLGEHHDAVVAHAWIGKAASEGRASEAFVAGMMAEMERRAAEQARAEFPAVWKRARRSRLRRWL
jgi:CHAD domain-containing protein